MIIELVKKFKSLFPTKIIFGGGPEVSYDTKSFVDVFDYVLSGEAEELILPFIDSVVQGTELPEGVATMEKPYPGFTAARREEIVDGE